MALCRGTFYFRMNPHFQWWYCLQSLSCYHSFLYPAYPKDLFRSIRDAWAGSDWALQNSAFIYWKSQSNQISAQCKLYFFCVNFVVLFSETRWNRAVFTTKICYGNLYIHPVRSLYWKIWLVSSILAVYSLDPNYQLVSKSWIAGI